jgi:orotidine-5'-phosphate decarboxylase
MEAKDRIICALDVDNAFRALQLVRMLREHVGVFKVGLELLNAAGMEIVERLQDAGASRIFYDAKLHDIPNTVAGAMHGIARLGVWSVTVHTTGGPAMLRAAVKAANQGETGGTAPGPKVLGVTVLTSIDPETLRSDLQVAMPLAEFVPFLAKQAYAAGCAGVIASPLEVAAVREAVSDPGFLIITPGVRPAGSDRGDQARVMTPGEAIRTGASYLVIGRPIVAASDPVEAAQQIAAEIAQAQ